MEQNKSGQYICIYRENLFQGQIAKLQEKNDVQNSEIAKLQAQTELQDQCENKIQTPLPRDCFDAYKSGHSLPAILTLQPDPSSTQSKFVANCLPGGWTVIQSRGQFNNPDDYFQKDWNDYVQGFGFPGIMTINM